MKFTTLNILVVQISGIDTHILMHVHVHAHTHMHTCTCAKVQIHMLLWSPDDHLSPELIHPIRLQGSTCLTIADSCLPTLQAPLSSLLCVN